MKTDYRIGAQILSPKMIECSFQHTDAVLETIESIRATAATVHDDYCRKLRDKPKEALMETRGYTNAISILGSRGSGKTSIILTLQHILRVGLDQWRQDWQAEAPTKTDSTNIMMPVLVPQDFSDKQPLLSWIISQLQNMAESVLEEIEQGNNRYWGAEPLRDWAPKMGNPTFSSPLAEAIEKLTTSFELRYKNEYVSLIRDGDQIYQYMDSVERDSNLMLDMLTLISMLIDYYRYRNGKKTAEEPLLFFVIDDLDMAPQRSNEVLNLLLRYLQHPNVVVLCGWNQELFQNHLCIELLKTQGVLNLGNVNENFGFDDVFMSRQRKRVTAIDSARRLAIDNLKKAFPPAQRFEIRGLTSQQRANFPLLSTTGTDDPKYFFELIEETITECIRRRSGVEPVEKSFLYNYGDPIYVYMRIFDNKSRGMINECKAFDELWKMVHNWDGKSPLSLTNTLNELVNTILFSTTRFAPFRRGIRDLIKITEVILDKENPKIVYFCDYKAVEKVMHDYADREQEWKDSHDIDWKYKFETEYSYFPYVIVDVYLLLDFMENFIRSIVGAPPVHHHAGHEFSTALNWINKPLEVDSTDKNLTIQALAAAGISEIPLFPETKSLRLCVLLLDNYEKHDFTDKQYSFSGTLVLCRMLNAVLGLCFENDKYILPKLTAIYNEDSRDWFDLIRKVSFALEASDNNIKRLARYQDCLEQNAYTDTTDILRAIKPTNAWNFDEEIAAISKEDKRVTDEDMKDLVFCLRETDKLRRSFANVLTDKSQKNSNEPTQIQRRYMLEAELFMEQFGNSKIRKNVDGWIDAKAYRRRINKYLAAPRTQQDYLFFNVTLIRDARDLADIRIENLLSALNERLKYAVAYNYRKQPDLTSQYKYLRSAASVIGDYLQTWELIDAGWTEEDKNAVIELQEIFLIYQMDTQYILTRRLAEYGPELAYSNRDVYKKALNDLKSWVNPRISLFNDDERKTIEKALNVLTRATEHIRRALIVEDRLFELLKDLGLLIAYGAGERACEIWKKKIENPKAWSSPVVWPVDGSNLAVVEEWCYKLRRAGWGETDSEEQNELKSKTTTKFDLEYLL